MNAAEERAVIVAYLRGCAIAASDLGEDFGAPGDEDRLICKLQGETLRIFAEAIERKEHLEWHGKAA